jgi:hypothetical protein
MEARIRALEDVVADIRTELRALRLEIVDLKSTVLKMQLDLAEVKGPVSQMPTMLQLVTLIIAIFGMAFAPLRFVPR